MIWLFIKAAQWFTSLFKANRLKAVNADEPHTLQKEARIHSITRHGEYITSKYGRDCVFDGRRWKELWNIE